MTSGYFYLFNPHFKVIFPEAERNWKGKDVGIEKFQGMYQRMPKFVGTIENFLPASSLSEPLMYAEDVYNVGATCSFKCSESGTDSTRVMLYSIRDEKIVRIVHK